MDIEDLTVHAESLRHLARRLVRDAAGADDVVQDACLAALKGGATSRPWLVGVVRNLSLRRRRDDARRDERERRAARPEATEPADEAVERAELHRVLLDELLALDEPYRATMLLRHVDGLAHAEIARRLRVPAGTVAARLHRGLELLRGRLDRRFGGRVSWCLLFLPFLGRPSAAALGVAVVSTKKTVTIAALLLLALGALVGTLLVNRGGGAPGARAERNAAAPAGTSTAPVEAAPPAPVDAAVDRDLDLFGTVVDASGAPIGNARVESFWYPWQRGSVGTGSDSRYFEEASGPAAATGVDGTFSLRLQRGQQVNLRTSAPGFTTTELTCYQAGERVRIVLGAGVRVVFECIDERGGRIPGVGIRLSRGEGVSRERNFVERRGETDADGRCVFDGLPAGQWAYYDARDGVHAGVWRRVVFPRTGEATVRLEIRAGRTLHGTVRDAESGRPIEGAHVGASWIVWRPVVTDAEGHYELPGWGLDGGTEDMGVAADGYARQARFVGTEDLQDFSLTPACDLRGRILGADGGAVGGALFCVRGRNSSDRFETYVQGTSAEDGTFLVRGIGRGITNTLTITAPGHGRYLLDFRSPEGREPIDLGDIRLPTPRSIEGRALFADGTPAPGILIALEGSNTDRCRLLEGGQPGFRTGGDREERRTDDLGRFRFRDLAPGAYTITCGTPGYKPVPLDVTLPEDGDATGVELRLAAGHTLTVRVADTQGRPVHAMSVNVMLADHWTMTCQTDAEGIARFEADARFEQVDLFDWDLGRYRLPPPRPLPSGTADVTIELEPAGVVEGIVLDTGGHPLPQAQMRIASNGELVSQGWGDAFSDLEGRFRVIVPASGETEIRLTGVVNASVPVPELPPFGGSAQVVAGAKNVVLRARPLTFDRTLKVRVLAPDGSALRGVQVYARTALGELVPGANVLTDAEGLATLKGLPDGEVSVFGKAVRLPAAEDWMDASAFPILAEGQTITVGFRQGLRVRGRVTSSGEPAGGTSVAVYRKTESVGGGMTDAEGYFSFLVPLGTEMPVSIVAMRWEGDVVAEGRQDGWEPRLGDLEMKLAPRSG